MCLLCAEYNNARKRVDQLHTLAGSSMLQQRLCGLSFRMSPLAFFQTNSRQTKLLYRTVADAAGVCTCPFWCASCAWHAERSAVPVLHLCALAGREQQRDRMRDGLPEAHQACMRASCMNLQEHSMMHDCAYSRFACRAAGICTVMDVPSAEMCFSLLIDWS